MGEHYLNYFHRILAGKDVQDFFNYYDQSSTILPMMPPETGATIEIEDGNEEVYTITLLTNNKEIVCYVCAIFSGCLSTVGSSTIVYKVVTNIKKSSPYDRIMLGLSSCDIIASCAYALSPFLPPESTSSRAWSIGNETTCSFLGFLTQFAFASVVYNTMLSFYYLFTVRLNVKKTIFAKRYEPWMHAISLIFGLATATSGVAVGLYSELDIGYGCWINDYPTGCELENGPDCTGQIFGMIFAALPTLIAFLCLLINNLVIYLFVRKHLKQGKDTRKPQDISTKARQGTVDIHPASSTMTMGSQQSRQILPPPNSPAYNDRIQEVRTQGILYVVTFLVAFTPAFVWRAMDAFRSDTNFDENDIFGLLVLYSLTLPLQGFFNMFVYNRPNYTRVRRINPTWSTFRVMRKACFSSDIPRLTEVVSSSLTATGHQVLNNTGSTARKSKNSLDSLFSFWSNLEVLPENSKGEDSSSTSSKHNGINEVDDDNKDNSETEISFTADQLSGYVPNNSSSSEVKASKELNESSFLSLYAGVTEMEEDSDGGPHEFKQHKRTGSLKQLGRGHNDQCGNINEGFSPRVRSVLATSPPPPASSLSSLMALNSNKSNLHSSPSPSSSSNASSRRILMDGSMRIVIEDVEDLKETEIENVIEK